LAQAYSAVRAMQQPMIAGVSPETTHDLSDSRAKRPFATVALVGVMVILGAACVSTSVAAPVEGETGHLMGWMLATRATGFALAPSMPRANAVPNLAPTAANVVLGNQLDLQRDALEASLNAGPGSAVHVDRAAAQLQDLLALDDVAAMDGQLFAMMQNGELDSGMAYELARTADLAAEAGDHGDAETLGHLQATLMYQVEQQVLGPMVEPTVAALLADVQHGQALAQAVEARLGQQDVAFLPEVAMLLEEASPAERPQLRAIVNELERRSAARFAAVKQQLRSVLQAGSVDAMDAAMASLVRRDEVGPGFLFVLAKAQEVAYANNADDAKALLGHLTSTLRKELRLAPAHALVSQLLAAPTAEARYALLARHVPTQQTLPLNRAGGALPLAEAAGVAPEALAAALDAAVAELPATPAAAAQVAEMRGVAMEIRAALLETRGVAAASAFALGPWAEAKMRGASRASAPVMTATQPEFGETREAAPPTPPPLPLIKTMRVGDKTLAGDAGFDPLEFADTPDALAWYREAEIKHARLAMLAAFGWPLSELTNFGGLLNGDGRAPSILNGGLGEVSPAYWALCVAAAIFWEGKGLDKQFGKKADYLPGMLGVDPLGMDSPAFREAEILNGRVAMVAITAFALEEAITKAPIFPINLITR